MDYSEIIERGFSVSPSGVVLDDAGNEYRDEQGAAVFVKHEKRWMICPTCSGEGSHSLRLGVITSSDRESWSDDEWENYMAGGYDEPCSTCNATGKITEQDYNQQREEFSETRWLPNA